MNIFILDINRQRCSEYTCDQHLNKMILESAQMLCTALNECKIQSPYSSFNPKHPCNIWVMKSLKNWQWLRDHALHLEKERQHRFGPRNTHKSVGIILSLTEPPLPDIGLTEFPQAMPDQYKVPGNPVQAYRNFYIHDKRRFATWTKRPMPNWFKKGDSSCAIADAAPYSSKTGKNI